MKKITLSLLFTVFLIALLPVFANASITYVDYTTLSLPTADADTRQAGVAFNTSTSVTATKLYKDSLVSATGCYIKTNTTAMTSCSFGSGNEDFTYVAQGAFSGDICTLTTATVLNANQCYILVVTGGSNRQLNAAGTPIKGNASLFTSFECRVGNPTGDNATYQCYGGASSITAISFNTIDPPTFSPSIDFTGQTPSNSTVKYITQNTFLVNTTASYFSTTSVTTTHYLYNSSGSLVAQNNGTASASANYTSNFSNLIAGTYTYNASATNGTMSNVTGSRTIIIYALTTGSLTVPSNLSLLAGQQVNFTWTNGTITPSGAVVNNFSLSIINITSGNTQSLLTSASFSFLNLSNYNLYNLGLSTGNYYFRVTYQDNNSNTVFTQNQLNITRNTLLNISVKDLVGGGLLTTGSVRIYDPIYGTTETFNTTNGFLQAPIVRSRTYTLLTNFTGYLNGSQSFTVADSSNGNLTLLMYNLTNISFGGNTPANATTIYISQQSITINATLSNLGIGVANITLFIYNSSGALSKSYSVNATSLQTTSAQLNFSSLDLLPDTYTYYATFNNGTINGTSIQTRTLYVYNITLVGNVTSPTNGSTVSTRYVNFTWSNSTITPSASSARITNFTLVLLNSDASTFNRTIGSTSQLNITLYDIYAQNLSLGTYWLRLVTQDNFNTTVSSLSSFTLGSNALLTVNITNNETGAIITGFNLSILNRNTSVTTNYTTTTTNITFDIVKGYTYGITILAGTNYSVITYNYTANQTNNQYVNYQVYPFNTISIYIYDEVTGVQLTGENIGVGLFSLTNSYNYSTNTGYLLVTNITEGDYDIIFTQVSVNVTAYGSRTYQLTMENSTHQNLDARLPPNSTVIEIYIKDIINNPLENALVTIQRNYAGTYLTIAQSTTDINGFLRFNLIEAYPYRVIIDQDGFVEKVFIIQFYGTNSPYTFVMTSTSSYIFTDVLNEISYSITPTNLTLSNSSNVTFTLNTYSTNSILEWASITTPQGTTNVSGTPAGMSPTRSENLLAYANLPYPVRYCFKADGYSLYCFTVNYIVQGGSTTSTIISNAQALSSSWNDNAGNFALNVLGTLVVLAIVLTLAQLTQNSNIATIGGFIGLMFFAIIGWFSVVQITALCIIGGIMFFTSRSGGGY